MPQLKVEIDDLPTREVKPEEVEELERQEKEGKVKLQWNEYKNRVRIIEICECDSLIYRYGDYWLYLGDFIEGDRNPIRKVEAHCIVNVELI